MSYGELNLQPERITRNAKTGRFLPGNVPFNKGKKWSEFKSKRSQKRSAKGWKNLDLYRGKTKRPDTAGRRCKAVIAVYDDGSWRCFSSALYASQILGIGRENICRCCRFNQERHVNRKTGKINTDHKCKVIRFYFETDDIWLEKIKQQ